MKLKLTKAEMQALEMIVDNLSNIKPNGNLATKLLLLLMDSLYIKIATRLIDLKSHYSFKVDPATCIAFCLIFENKPLNPAVYEDNLTLKLINQFKQHYAHDCFKNFTAIATT